MVSLDLYWATNPNWWHFDEYYNRVLNDDAPKEAKESYEHYLEQHKRNTA